MTRFLMTALFVFLCGAQPLFAQVQVTSNEAMEGRINNVNEKNEWKIELKEDGHIRFNFNSSQMTHARINLFRADGQRVPLSGVGGTGRFSGFTKGDYFALIRQGVLDVTVQSSNELPQGTYRLIVTTHKSSDTPIPSLGAYTLAVHEPKFQPKNAQMPTNKTATAGSVAQLAGSTDRTEQIDLRSEFAAIRRELQELREEIRMLKERK